MYLKPITSEERAYLIASYFEGQSIPCLEKRFLELDINEIKTLIWSAPASIICRIFNIATKTLRDRCKELKVDRPPQSFWAKVNLRKIPHPQGKPVSRIEYRALQKASEEANKKGCEVPGWAVEISDVIWTEITKEQLTKLLWSVKVSDVASFFAVSDKAVRKKSDRFQISRPPKDFWKYVKSGLISDPKGAPMNMADIESTLVSIENERVKKLKEKKWYGLVSDFHTKKWSEMKENELAKLVWMLPFENIGELFDISGRAVAKKCKIMGVESPPQGYWASKSYERNSN